LSCSGLTFKSLDFEFILVHWYIFRTCRSKSSIGCRVKVKVIWPQMNTPIPGWSAFDWKAVLLL